MPEHKGKTNKVNEVKLESSVDRVVWTTSAASVGANAGLEIDTHFVGNGSDIKIELKDGSGKSVGNLSKKISGNKLWAQVKIPDNAKNSLVAKVKLPKHSAEMQSNPLIVLPPINIKNLKWDKKEARRGDILTMTADVETVPDGTEAEIEIWEHDADEVHDLITTIPVEVKGKKIECKWEYEYHEDTDEIPTDEEVERGYNPPEYFFRVKVNEVFEDSELLVFKDWIEIELIDDEGNPIADQEFEIIFADGSTREGTLDDKGKVCIEDIAPGSYNIIYKGSENQNRESVLVEQFGNDENEETEADETFEEDDEEINEEETEQ